MPKSNDKPPEPAGGEIVLYSAPGGDVRVECLLREETIWLTQQQIAEAIGVNRSVINRQIMGKENLTLRSVAEIAWALGWEIVFHLRKPVVAGGQNHPVEVPSWKFPETTSEQDSPPVVHGVETQAVEDRIAA